MTLQDLGSLGELLGGIAVVVSLLYLAIQVRHNTRGLEENKKLMRFSFENEIRKEQNEFRAMIAADAELADLWRRGLAGDTTLDASENLRFDLLSTNLGSLLRAQFFAQSRDLYPAEGGEFLRIVMRTPGFRKWWSKRRLSLREPELVAHVENILSESEQR